MASALWDKVNWKTLERALAALADAQRRAQLKREMQINVLAAPDASIASANVFVLAVKPQDMARAAHSIARELAEIGVAAVKNKKGELYWCQVFGKPGK